MEDNKNPKKLVSPQKVILIIGAALAGIGIFCYRAYFQEGHFSKTTIIAAVLTGIISLCVCGSMIWYANKRE
jgi:hypothetical protein